MPDLKAAAKLLAEARRDGARLDWVFNSNACTSEEMAELVNGFIWRGKYRGSGRAAIDAAMEGK